jgi:hypothetical protein
LLTSGRHALTESIILSEPVSPAPTGGAALARARLVADAARRLGPRACLLAGWHRLRLRSGLAALALGEVGLPAGPLLPASLPDAGATGDAARFAAAAEAAMPASWHGPFPADAPGLGLDLFSAGDIRPVWEANRLLALPLLAKAACLAPADGHLARAEAVLRGWIEANPPYRGPAWACGQEAALRALHVALALVLLKADRTPQPAMRALLAIHAGRIEATRAYASAQDNNHAVSEPAGLFVIGLLLGDATMAARGARGLAHAVARLVAPDGTFAQASPAYHRLLLDTLVVAEWFRRRHGAPPFDAPFADRAEAATVWLQRVMHPTTGALPRCGAVDDSALADLSLHGPLDARGSVGRAMALFWRGNAPGQPARCQPEGSRWHSTGWIGERTPRFQLLLRTATGLRFRPAQADFLHLDLALDGAPLLIDGGTGAYNPPPGCAWCTDALAGTAGHNTVQFDGQDQMPRISRFLFARWPDGEAVPGGAAIRDARGNRHERRLQVATDSVTVEDRVAGPFTQLALRWRLAPGDWRLTPDGVEGPRARLRLTADAPCRIRLAAGWHSPAYGRVEPAPVLELTAAAPVARLTTRIEAG